MIKKQKIWGGDNEIHYSLPSFNQNRNLFLIRYIFVFKDTDRAREREAVMYGIYRNFLFTFY